MRRFIAFFVAAIGIFGLAYGQTPQVNMVNYSNVTITGAKFFGNLASKGSWTVNGKGFVYSTNPVPTAANGTLKSVSGTALGDYNTTVNNLSPSTTYYVRAYVKRGTGSNVEYTYSSNTLTFTTLEAEEPTLTTPVVSAITLTGATFSASITDKGDATLQSNKNGFVYSTNPNPTFYSTRAQVDGSVSTLPVSLTKTVNGLQSGVTYYVRTYSIIRYGSTFDTVYSQQVSFQTQHACGSVPFGTTITDVGVTEAVVHFNGTLGQVSWEVDYGFAGHNAGEGTIVPVTDTLLALSGLEGGRSYAVFVRATCGSNLYSDWSDIRTFTTVAPPCADVSGVHARELGYSSAKIEWTPGSMSQTMWEVVFAKASDALPTSGVIVENDPMFSPIGLMPQTEYKLKVRALCSEFQSDWSDEFRFNTIEQGLEDVAVETVKVYPNPTSGTITFSAPKMEIFDVEISSAAGQLLYKGNTLPESFSFGANKGIFFLHIDTEYGHQVEKIIVQ